MGKMSFGKLSKKPVLPVAKKVMVDPTNVLERLAKLEAQEPKVISQETIIRSEPQILEQKVVEKTTEQIHTIKEVSVITKDTKARKHSKIVASMLKNHQLSAKIAQECLESVSADVRLMQDGYHKILKRIDELECQKQKLELQIDEQNQLFKPTDLTKVYIVSGLAILLSLLSLIIK